MPLLTVHQAETRRLEVLGADGVVDAALMPDLAPDQIRNAYRLMCRMRGFDEKALKLQRQGRLGTYASVRGQEATQAGLALAMRATDWLVPSFREHGVLEARGVPMHLVYAYWKGDERGSGMPADARSLPVSIPVGSQWVHAAGLGLAMRLKGDDAVVVGCGGDGSTSEGDFHEGLNFAAVFRSRTLFFVQNNQWAISVPLKQQTASATIAQKADAYGMPGLQVDGNDVFAVFRAVSEALAAIRAGGGPQLIESKTYRLESHTTADDATRYRDAAEVERWRSRDPILRLRRYLDSQGLWDDDTEATMQAAIAAEVEAEVEKLESMPPPDPEDAFKHVYAEMPWYLREQRDALLAEVKR